MSDHLDPDDLASAALDDDVDPAGRARIDADPALRARLRELGDVRAMLAATPPPGAAARETAIAAALDAFDELRAGAGHELPAAITRPPAPVLSLVARRRVRWALSAAAATVVVVGGAIALTQGRGDDTDSAATATAPAADSFEAPAERSQLPQSAGDEAPSATDAPTGGGAPEIGEAPAVVADGSALDAQVLRNGDDLVRYASEARTVNSDRPTSTDTQAPAATVPSSDATFATEDAPAAALLSCVLEAPFTDVVPVGPAQYNGVDVEVFRAVDTSLAGSPVVALAVDRFTCVVVDRQPIP